MTTFVRVADARSFTRAARATGLTPSGVSRVISRLEARLGVRLIERTTRSLGLTADGMAYYERCADILRAVEDAEAAVASSRTAPRGRLRVDVPTVLGRFVIGPALPEFLRAHQQVAIDLSVRDQLVDPVADGIDVVLRMAALRDTELLQRKLGTMRVVVVASPEYLKERGRPAAPDELRQHERIGFLTEATAPAPAWRFRSEGREVSLPCAGRLRSNNVDALRAAALAGLGLVQLFELHVRDELSRGTLKVVLSRHEPAPRPIYALYTKSKAALPKVRAFLDFVSSALRSV